jgi:hypothetical protein
MTPLPLASARVGLGHRTGSDRGGADAA